MKKMKLMLGLVIFTAFILGACSANQPVNNTMNNKTDNSMDNTMEEPIDNSSDVVVNNDSGDMVDSGNDSMEDTSSDMMGADNEETADSTEAEKTLPLWYTYEYEDPTTGKTFAISDFEGSVVLMETMAMWCSNCLAQQKEIIKLHEMLGERDDFVSVGINIDPEEDIVMVAAYVEAYGFDWLYGIAPLDVYVDIGATLGAQFQNPPSVPIVLIDKNGNVHALPFGIKSAEALQSLVEPYLD
jgi:cytochrome oxidase Cu insertion factor (SCO1/SenC/PrrC family)